MLRSYILNKYLHNLMLLLLAAHKDPSIKVTPTHLTLSLWIKVKSIQFQSEGVIFDNAVSHVGLKT